MVADRRKRAKFAQKGEGEDLLLGQVDEKLVVHIEKLQEVQDELEKVNEEASDKVLEVEQKYNEVRRPIYRKRKDVIQLIPDFWLTAILSHPVLGDLVTENDQKILKYLVSLEVEDFKDLKSGYSITFSFSPNPYFEDENLTKTISFTDEATASVAGSAIKWKEGMDISNGSDQTNGPKRPFEEDSFFNWFNEAQQKTVSDGLGDEVAEIIKEDLWPNPLKYFNNETDEEDLDGEEDDDEDKGTEDDEEDDDDDDADEHYSNGEDD